MSFPVENIRKACKDKGITLAQLERELGFGNGVIARWEKSKGTPPFDRIKKIADFLDVSILYLSTGKDKREKFQQDVDKTKAFEQQLKAFGWECEFLDCQDWEPIENGMNPKENSGLIGCEHPDGKSYKCESCPYRQPHYRFSSNNNGNRIDFNVSPSDYTSFLNDVEKFYKERIQELLHVAFQGTFIDQEYSQELMAAHEDSAGATPEQKQHADEIMMDDKEWK